MRPAESEKTEEIREKEVPGGSERGKRARGTREVSEGGEKMQKILIVVDMQNDFIDGALGTPEAVAIVPRVEQKIREFPGKVIFTRDTHGERYLETQEGKHLPVPHCIKGEAGWDLFGKVAGLKEEQDMVFSKPTFGSIELADYLRDRADEYESVELAGVVTNICVISNMVLAKAAMPEVLITVDASCVASNDPEMGEKALALMENLHVKVIK